VSISLTASSKHKKEKKKRNRRCKEWTIVLKNLKDSRLDIPAQADCLSSKKMGIKNGEESSFDG
jgi:hypothetical protein